MKDFLLWLVKGIVDNPDKVSAEEFAEEGQVNLQLAVAPEDMGKVIGKGGKIIKSIRHLLRVKGVKEGKRVNLSLLEG